MASSKRFIAALAATALIAGSALAAAVQQQAPAASGFKRYDGPAKTRQEAIQRAKERAANSQEYVKKLEGMSDEEWGKQAQARQAKREQFRQMTPEQRAETRKKMLERRNQTQADQAAPAPASASR